MEDSNEKIRIANEFMKTIWDKAPEDIKKPKVFFMFYLNKIFAVIDESRPMTGSKRIYKKVFIRYAVVILVESTNIRYAHAGMVEIKTGFTKKQKKYQKNP